MSTARRWGHGELEAVQPQALQGTQVCACVYMHCVYIQVGKESAGNAGDPGSIPGLGRSTGEGNEGFVSKL